MADAHGFINNVWIAGDIMNRMLNSGFGNIAPGAAGVYPDDILVSNHDSVTYPRESLDDPSTLASKMQSMDSTVDFYNDFQVSDAIIDPQYWWAWNLFEWEFAQYVGSTYTLEAASLAGRVSGLYQDWAAFGPVKYPTVINPTDIVVYLVGFFRVGYGKGTTP